MTESDSALEVVNIAATGYIGSETDIQQVSEDIDLAVANYDPEFNAAFLRFVEDEELLILYTSGKYILRGGDDFDRMHSINRRFMSALSSLGVEVHEPEFDVKNVVCVGDLDEEVDLNSAIVSLGLEDTEYEPEQFPGLVYRSPMNNCVLLVFSSGKVVITGGATKQSAVDAFQSLRQKLLADGTYGALE